MEQSVFTGSEFLITREIQAKAEGTNTRDIMGGGITSKALSFLFILCFSSNSVHFERHFTFLNLIPVRDSLSPALPTVSKLLSSS